MSILSIFSTFLCGSSGAGRTIDKQSRVLGFESILSWKGLTLCYLRGLKRVELWAKSEFWKHLLLLRIKRSFKPKLTLIKLCKHTCNKLECLSHVYTSSLALYMPKPTRVEPHSVLHFHNERQASPTNSSLGRKCLLMTNALAYDPRVKNSPKRFYKIESKSSLKTW